MGQAPRLLSELSRQELYAERRSQFAKWAGPCQLRFLGYPTLDAVLIPPGIGERFIARAVEKLSRLRSHPKLIVRSDGGPEKFDYPKLGNSLPLQAARKLSEELSNSGRAVILLEPTNRFTNNRTMNVACDFRGDTCTAAIEFLGPGFDVSDLTRGGITPQVTVVFHDFSRVTHCYPTILDTTVSIDMDGARDEERRLARLARIGSDILPKTGVQVEGDASEFATNWLRVHGYLSLWRPWTPTLRKRCLRHLFDDIFTLVSQAPSSWVGLGTSASDLGDGRSVYWDIINPACKWSIK